MQRLLNEYQYSDGLLSIPPDDLRDALATSISASFKTGNLGDPTEAYTAVLERLCEQLTGQKSAWLVFRPVTYSL